MSTNEDRGLTSLPVRPPFALCSQDRGEKAKKEKVSEIPFHELVIRRLETRTKSVGLPTLATKPKVPLIAHCRPLHMLDPK